ncbi:MAG: DUF421 domain-containing protein [Oscillibacter sp.]
MATAFIRTIVLYFLIMVGLRLLGKRQIGELEPIELVLTLLISDLAAVPMQDFGIPLLNGVIPIVTLLLLSMLLSWGSVRSIRLRRLICGSPTALILDGKVQQDAMRHNRFTLDELIEELRSQGVTDLTSVKYAVLETDGQLSVLLYPDEQPATPKQLGKPVKDDTFLPHIFINDGRVMGENLSLAGLDAAWLDKTVRAQGYHAPSEIFCSRSTARAKFCASERTVPNEAIFLDPVLPAARALWRGALECRRRRRSCHRLVRSARQIAGHRAGGELGQRAR